MKVSRFTRMLSLTLSVVMLLALVSGVGAQDDEPKVLVTGLSMVGGDLNTIDPAISEASSENQVISEMFIGLTTQDETTADIVPGLATSWDISEDGTVYTYHLLEDVPWVHYNEETGAVEQVMDESGNPRFVTASDLIYGWTRTLDPETASTYSYVLAPYVLNGAEFNAGEAEAADLGMVAVDDYTLEVTLPEAVGFAPAVHGLWIASPMPQWAVEEGGDSWTEPEFSASYGPYALKEWAHDESITLIANPFWPGVEYVPQPKIDEIVFRFLDPQAQFAEFQAGTIQAIDVPLEELDRVRADAELSPLYSNGSRACTYYIGFDNTEDPVTNLHLRRALSLAVDRQDLVDNVTKGGQIPAQWFARPGLNAAPTLDTHPDLGITYDPEAAQAELALALEELGLASVADLPPLSLSYGDGAGHAAITAAIQDMWSTNLGIEVQLNAMDPTTYFSAVSEDAPVIYRTGWCQDYPDANNFLFDVFHSESSQNDPGFANAEFDALVEQARTETDTEVRRDLYAQAEEILVDQEAGIIPIYWYTTNQLTAPNVERTYSIVGREKYEKWDILPA